MRTFLSLVALIVLLALFSRSKDDARAPHPTSNLDPAVRKYIQPAPAQAVAERYDANEVAAERDYKDKTGAVFGRVTDIGVDFLGSPYIILDGDRRPYGVRCSFDRSRKTSVAALHKGDNVAVQGVFGGKVMHVQMSDCSLEN